MVVSGVIILGLKTENYKIMMNLWEILQVFTMGLFWWVYTVFL